MGDPIEQFQWDFGDGTAPTVLQGPFQSNDETGATHRFPETGAADTDAQHTVTLTATNSSGETAYATQRVSMIGHLHKKADDEPHGISVLRHLGVAWRWVGPDAWTYEFEGDDHHTYDDEEMREATIQVQEVTDDGILKGPGPFYQCSLKLPCRNIRVTFPVQPEARLYRTTVDVTMTNDDTHTDFSDTLIEGKHSSNPEQSSRPDSVLDALDQYDLWKKSRIPNASIHVDRSNLSNGFVTCYSTSSEGRHGPVTQYHWTADPKRREIALENGDDPDDPAQGVLQIRDTGLPTEGQDQAVCVFEKRVDNATTGPPLVAEIGLEVRDAQGYSDYTNRVFRVFFPGIDTDDGAVPPSPNFEMAQVTHDTFAFKNTTTATLDPPGSSDPALFHWDFADGQRDYLTDPYEQSGGADRRFLWRFPDGFSGKTLVTLTAYGDLNPLLSGDPTGPDLNTKSSISRGLHMSRGGGNQHYTHISLKKGLYNPATDTQTITLITDIATHKSHHEKTRRRDNSIVSIGEAVFEEVAFGVYPDGSGTFFSSAPTGPDFLSAGDEIIPLDINIANWEQEILEGPPVSTYMMTFAWCRDTEGRWQANYIYDEYDSWTEGLFGTRQNVVDFDLPSDASVRNDGLMFTPAQLQDGVMPDPDGPHDFNGLRISFANTSNIAQGTPISWTWTFDDHYSGLTQELDRGDPGYVDPNEQVFIGPQTPYPNGTHRFLLPGLYNITLSVSVLHAVDGRTDTRNITTHTVTKALRYNTAVYIRNGFFIGNLIPHNIGVTRLPGQTQEDAELQFQLNGMVGNLNEDDQPLVVLQDHSYASQAIKAFVTLITDWGDNVSLEGSNVTNGAQASQWKQYTREDPTQPGGAFSDAWAEVVHLSNLPQCIVIQVQNMREQVEFQDAQGILPRLPPVPPAQIGAIDRTRVDVRPLNGTVYAWSIHKYPDFRFEMSEAEYQEFLERYNENFFITGSWFHGTRWMVDALGFTGTRQFQVKIGYSGNIGVQDAPSVLYNSMTFNNSGVRQSGQLGVQGLSTYGDPTGHDRYQFNAAPGA